MMSAVQPNSSPLLTSGHFVPTTSAPHSTRQTAPSSVITASARLTQRPQNTAALAHKWHEPVFSSMPTKLDRHQAQSKMLPLIGPLSTQPIAVVDADRYSPVTAAFDLSAAAECQVSTPPVDLAVPTAVASGYMQAAKQQDPLMTANLIRREETQPDPYQGRSEEPSRAPALHKLVTEPAECTANVTDPPLTSAPANSMSAVATPAKANMTPAKASTANMTPAEAAATQQVVVAGSSEKKKGGAGKKRKLLAPSLGVASLFDTFSEAQEPMQDHCKGDSTAQQPTAGVECPFFFVSA